MTFIAAIAIFTAGYIAGSPSYSFGKGIEIVRAQLKAWRR